ncbi:hypothetical protein ACQPU1_05325 [Clostridium paraputrificum]|uniref:hypothetical protein n=1 Tax=Clostridium TaxID=1485 RepID=UPI003D353010
MKKIFKILTIFICSLIFTGCSITNGGVDVNIKAPKNNKLGISGVWKVSDYSVKDRNISTQSQIDEIIENSLIIKNNSIKIGSKTLSGVNYKLKVVDKNYMLSYEANFKVSDLGIDYDSTNIYSITYQNNILGEIIYQEEGSSYFYYEGVIFTINIESEIEERDEDFKANKYDDEKKGLSQESSSQGVYIGLKSSDPQNNGKEEYRTLWISTKENELQEIKEKSDIIFPRTKGIWVLKKETIEDKELNIDYEYFVANSIDGKAPEANIEKDSNIKIFEDGINIKRSLNFVGNDYIATEVTRSGKIINSPKYEVLPIDNLHSEKAIVIGDIYPEETNKIYQRAYENAYKSLDSSKTRGLSKYIDYSNFTLVRSNGKWVLQGRISSISDGIPYDYPLNITPNQKLINYDTLIIPWKVLKGEIPFIVDAFISPDGKLGIIVTKNELLIYEIQDGNLGLNPLKRIQLKDGEEVIMSEWCAGDYVDKWGSVFKENSRSIE